MNPETGEIFDKEDIKKKIKELEEELKKVNKSVDIPEAKIKELQDKLKETEKMVDIPNRDFMKVVNMNRHQRREWAAKQRKKKKR